jgi:hypothetical protein
MSRRGERREQCEARQLLPRRHSREPLLDEFEIVADRVQVAAGLIDLAQRERAFVWHTHVMPEVGCSIVSGDRPGIRAQMGPSE